MYFMAVKSFVSGTEILSASGARERQIDREGLGEECKNLYQLAPFQFRDCFNSRGGIRPSKFLGRRADQYVYPWGKDVNALLKVSRGPCA